MIKKRKLQEGYRFNIVTYVFDKSDYPKANIIDLTQVKFTHTDGSDLAHYETLTPMQWQRASAYLTRELTPFIGYRYSVKPQYAGINATYKIV